MIYFILLLLFLIYLNTQLLDYQNNLKSFEYINLSTILDFTNYHLQLFLSLITNITDKLYIIDLLFNGLKLF